MIALPEGTMLHTFAKCTDAHIISDDLLDAWADFYQQEPVLREQNWFDVFIRDPIRHCQDIGILPRPHYGAAPEGNEYRHLLPRQRYVAGRLYAK